MVPGGCLFQLPIFDLRVAIEPIKNLEIGNDETDPLPQCGPDLMTVLSVVLERPGPQTSEAVKKN